MLTEQAKADHRAANHVCIPAPAAAPAVRDGLTLSDAIEGYLDAAVKTCVLAKFRRPACP